MESCGQRSGLRLSGHPNPPPGTPCTRPNDLPGHRALLVFFGVPNSYMLLLSW